MANRNTLRQIKLIIYKLKRQYGLPAILKHPLTSAYDVTTGETSITYRALPIKRVIRLPRRQISDFVYDLSFIAANKNFTYGGYFDTNDRMFLIDTSDLPQSYRLPNPTEEITTEDYLIIDNRRYKIYEIVLAEHDQGYLLRGREIVSSDSES